MDIGFHSSQKLIQLQCQQCLPGIHSSREPCTFQDKWFCFSKSIYVCMKLSDSFEKSLQPPRWPESLGFFPSTRRQTQPGCTILFRVASFLTAALGNTISRPDIWKSSYFFKNINFFFCPMGGGEKKLHALESK